jgi:3-(3-hydroxy-phenyl)propionate hydroxylase
MIRPGEDPQAFLDDRRISSLLSAWVDEGDIVVDRKAVYRFHGLVAKEWRRGRVILAGDAAHQTPPFAGQGMCSGIRDAANLSWKLGHVLRGEASDAMLDSYQTEREPHVRALTEAAIAMGRVVCMADPEAAAQRDAALLAQRAQGLQPVPPPDPRPGPGLFAPASSCPGSIFPQQIAPGQMLDDVMGVGAWLIVRKAGDAQKPEAACPLLRIESLDGDLLKPFAQRIITWLDEMHAEAVLVRADRYVFGAGKARDLLQAWSQALLGHVAAT